MIAVTFVCRDCGGQETRYYKQGSNGKPIGGRPKVCRPCNGKNNNASRTARYRRLFGEPFTTPWTPELKALAMRLRHEGKTAQQTARILGPKFTKNSIIGQWHRLGGYKRRSRAGQKGKYSRYTTGAIIKPADRQMTNDELRAYRAAQPKDTRDMGAVLMGDPPAHRSALAMRNGTS